MAKGWTKEQDKLLIELCATGKYHYKDLEPYFNKTFSTIRCHCYSLGITNNNPSQRKYSFNDKYFSNIGLDQCYYAALLVTDGCLYEGQQRRFISWGVAIKDKCLLEDFLKKTESNFPLREYQIKCNVSTLDKNKLHKYASLRIHDPKGWISDLYTNFGFTRNKTLRFPPPNLPTIKHKLAFIRGFIDGDGTITYGETIRDLTISVCGKNRELILWFKEVVDSLNLPTLAHRTSNIMQVEDENCYYYKRTGLTAAILFEIISRIPVYCLERKWKNPKILERLSYWKSRPEWPPESFFEAILRDENNSLPSPIPDINLNPPEHMANTTAYTENLMIP